MNSPRFKASTQKISMFFSSSVLEQKKRYLWGICRNSNCLTPPNIALLRKYRTTFCLGKSLET